MLRRAAATAATLVVVLSGLTACGGDEEPTPEPTASSAFDPEALELGRIEPTGTDVSTALDGATSRLIGAYQLGSKLVLPQQLRSGLDKYGIETGALTTPVELELSLSDAAPAMVGTETGLLTRRVDAKGDAWITTALLQFPDEAAAEAAEQAAAAALTVPDPDGFSSTLTIQPVASDDQATAVVATEDDVSNQMYVLRAYGPFLAYGWFYDINGDLDDQREYADEFLQDQEVALEDVERVTVSEEPRVRDLDPSGLWGLTLAPDAAGGLSESAYVSGGHAAQTRQINSNGVSRAFNRAGVSRVASNLTTIYAAEDATGAERLHEAFLEQTLTLGMVEVDPPPGLDDAVCLANEDEENFDLTLFPPFLCFTPFDSYLLESDGVSLEEAQQRLSAQAVVVYENQQDQKRSSG
ncbi:hypothetical protein [Aeromicrobium sp. Leaf350]|uniref:DUF7373 family lipoprotein n=1 Tax=Aeromicrobium sp. Leaf350 TaxID=2876565 RepID=UPI001E3C7B3C|nr:hypothetical protein [Aeromicrobium sp. Leaf350]